MNGAIVLTAYKLRHTAASLLHELTGGNLKSVLEFLRHTQIGTTADVYVHRENTAVRASSELLASKMFNDIENAEVVSGEVN